MAVERLRLPPEIIGEIVSFASDNRQTLLSCALVCQDWLSESRTVLLRDIDVSSKKAFRSFVTNVLHSERLHPWLTSTHDMWVKFFDGIGGTEPEAFVLEISKRLPNLRTMGLTHSHWTQHVCPPLRTDLFPALGQLASLYELFLGHCTFTSFGELRNVIVALPALSVLWIVHVGFPDGDVSDQSSPLPGPLTRPTLFRLFITFVSHKNILYDWLAITPTRTTLRDLSLDFEDIVAGWQMIAGTSLKTLTIQNMESVRSNEAFPIPGFAQLWQQLSGTEEIEFLRMHADFAVHRFSWGEMTCALRPFVSAGAVYVLRLCCSPDHYSEDDGEVFYEDLEELDPVLEGGAFAHLTVVEFVSFLVCQDEVLPEKYEQFSGWLEYKLPSLHERVAVELYVYNAFTVLGPSGTFEPLYTLGGPDFPHGNPML